MDVLSDVLRAVRLTGAIFFDHYVRAPFVGGSPPSAAIAGGVMPEAEARNPIPCLAFGLLLDSVERRPWAMRAA